MGIILTFAGIHRALAAEKAARGLAHGPSGRAPELVPLPASIKSDCGFGLLFEDAASLGDGPAELARIGIEYECAYRIVEKERLYERID
jgi:hypothetical protein